MAIMIRKQIYLEQRQNELIKHLAEIRGVSEAEVIRQAIDQNAQQGFQALPPDAKAWEEALAFMEGLHEQGPSGEPPYQWRREDAYEERLSRYDRDTD